VNPSVGLSELIGLAEEIAAGVPLGMVHAATDEAAQAAIRAVQAAYIVGTTPPEDPPLVLKRIV